MFVQDDLSPADLAIGTYTAIPLLVLRQRIARMGDGASHSKINDEQEDFTRPGWRGVGLCG